MICSLTCIALIYSEIISPDSLVLAWVLTSLTLSLGRLYFISIRSRTTAHDRLVELITLQTTTELTREMSDYEVLLALDDTIDIPRGASQELINALPHILAPDDSECNICLDTIKAQEKVTILTCTHAFHSECVDQWLKIKSCCPVCKTNLF